MWVWNNKYYSVVEKLEECGRTSVQRAIHLPVNGYSNGWKNHTLKSLIRLIKKGDEHGKSERLLEVSLIIKAPRYIWQELDTYTVGVTPGSSTSTMYTLMKTLDEIGGIEELEYDDYFDLFSFFDKSTDIIVVEDFYKTYLKLKVKYIDKKELLNRVKAALPEGFVQIRVRKFSYQTLRRMYKQRKNHRLQWWHDFFDELIPQLNEQELIKETWML